MTGHELGAAKQYFRTQRRMLAETSGGQSQLLPLYDTAFEALEIADRLATLERISDGGWVSFRRHLDAWLLESSRYHGRGATIPEAIDRVEFRPQLQGEA